MCDEVEYLLLYRCLAETKKNTTLNEYGDISVGHPHSYPHTYIHHTPKNSYIHTINCTFNYVRPSSGFNLIYISTETTERIRNTDLTSLLSKREYS